MYNFSYERIIFTRTSIIYKLYCKWNRCVSGISLRIITSKSPPYNYQNSPLERAKNKPPAYSNRNEAD
jgi:hypothetical protein